MREICMSGSVGAPAGDRRGYPTKLRKIGAGNRLGVAPRSRNDAAGDQVALWGS